MPVLGFFTLKYHVGLGRNRSFTLPMWIKAQPKYNILGESFSNRVRIHLVIIQYPVDPVLGLPPTHGVQQTPCGIPQDATEGYTRPLEVARNLLPVSSIFMKVTFNCFYRPANAQHWIRRWVKAPLPQIRWVMAGRGCLKTLVLGKMSQEYVVWPLIFGSFDAQF